MIRSKLEKLRSLIIKASASLSDRDALQAAELFPKWSAELSYNVGDRVRYGDTLYKCLQAHTAQASWTPADSPSLWVRVDDPSQEFPEWVQPTGATDAYPKGAKVSHNNRHWISEIDANVYEPPTMWTESEV